MTRTATLLACLGWLGLTGCGPIGWIYTEKTEPFVIDMNVTKVGSKMAELSSKEIHEPVTAAGIGIEWKSRAIGEAAKKHGITDVYFADIQTTSVFGGVFRMQTIQVYGD
ncbi:MAG: hypothetical protein JNL94_05840 [Planctomycetes bacterium]|nr:hypothetical protein [Planctomycetota bacterium]